jgi:hypothetical protein
MQKILLTLFSITCSLNAFAWGQTGHRVTGAIAEQYLTPKARTAIHVLLPLEDLAEASTYADEMRSNPKEFWQKIARPFHYVTIPAGKRYAQIGAPKEGDAVSALTMFSTTLRVEQKRLALRFVIHIIGDLHQPLHAGNGKDKGGNDIKINFFWKDSNLHRVWDSEMLDQRQLSYTEWTAQLSRKISPQDVKAWSVTDPLIWIAESSRIRDEIYPQEEKISWDYLYVHMPQVKRRLQMAGVRMAAYLNEIYQ